MNIEVEGGYDSDGPFVIGVNSGAERVGFGASNQFAAMSGKVEHKSLHQSLTSEQARAIGYSLIEHADRLEYR